MLRAIVKNPDRDLLPGIYINATQPQGVMAKALLVPQQVVTRDPSGTPHCLVVTTHKKVASLTLTIAGGTGNKSLVTKGFGQRWPRDYSRRRQDQCRRYGQDRVR